MTTAFALEQLSDRGKFERIVIRILRLSDPECRSVIQTGGNALDEPIAAPVDGFGRVPGVVPPRFIQIQCATDERKRLREKWLGARPSATPRTRRTSKAEEGDLIKAAREADKLRLSYPEASFKVYLVTNQWLKQELYNDVYAEADRRRVECEIWEQSLLAGFLDQPDGQVCRRDLGIPPQDLSRDLVREIGQATLVKAQRNAFTEAPYWVDRRDLPLLESAVESLGHGLVVLAGDPGRGKSVLGMQLLEKHLRGGGLGLRVNATRAESSERLDEAIARTLRDHMPSLVPDQAQAIDRHLRPGELLLVLVEDINRVRQPSILLSKLINWCRPYSASLPEMRDGDSAPSVPRTVVLAPVWPSIRNACSARMDETPWLKTVDIGRMEWEEAHEALRNVLAGAGLSLGDARRASIIGRLERDPILLGLLGRLLKSRPWEDPSELADNVATRYIRRCCEESREQLAPQLIVDDLERALDTLARSMLDTRELRPRWNDLAEKFRDDHVIRDSLRALIGHGGVIRLESSEGASTVDFRHDRIRHEVLADSIQKLIARREYPESLFDPFFAGMVGDAVARIDVDDELLDMLIDRSPLAAFEAIRASGQAKPQTGRVVARTIDWCKCVAANGSLLPSMLEAIAWVLFETDALSVPELVHALPTHPILLLAGLRNGSSECGVRFLARRKHFVIDHYFYPLEMAVETGLARHRRRLIEDLREILIDPDLPDLRRKGGLELAGLFASPELEEEISHCYRGASDRELVFIPAVWTSLRCLGNDPKLHAIPLLEQWRSLSRDRSKGNLSQMGEVAESLRFAFTRGIPEPAIRLLTGCIPAGDQDFGWSVFWALEYVNLPDALEYRIREVARITLAEDVVRTWDQEEWRTSAWRLSDASWDRTRALWVDSSNDQLTREIAFRVWLTRCRPEELTILQQFDRSSILFQYALRKRAKLGDLTCVPELCEQIRNDINFLYVAPRVWCKSVMDVTEEHFQSLASPADDGESKQGWVRHVLWDVLRHIPDEAAGELLVRHWGHLRHDRKLIHMALYIGGPQCVELAEKAIRGWRHDRDVFEHLGFTFGFLYHDRRDLTIAHADRLRPYLHQIGDHDLRSLADFCVRRGYHDWIRTYLLPHLAKGQFGDLCLTDEGLAAFAGDVDRAFINYWALQGVGAHAGPGRILPAAHRLLLASPTMQTLKIVAEVIASVGSRSDIQLLEQVDVPDTAERERILSDTRFRVEHRSPR